VCCIFNTSLEHAVLPPAVNRVEVHPRLQQVSLTSWVALVSKWLLILIDAVAIHISCKVSCVMHHRGRKGVTAAAETQSESKHQEKEANATARAHPRTEILHAAPEHVGTTEDGVKKQHRHSSHAQHQAR
jgi:hypothetical protein